MIPVRKSLMQSVRNGLQVQFPAHAVTNNAHCGDCITTTDIDEPDPVIEEPAPIPTMLWSHGAGIVQKLDTDTLESSSFTDIGNTNRASQVHHDSKRVFISTNAAIYIFDASVPADPIGTPVEITFPVVAAQINPHWTAIDQAANVYAAIGGANDNAILVFDDNSTQTLDMTGQNPSMVFAIGNARFVFWGADDGLLRLYGPANDYAEPLVASTTPIWFPGNQVVVDLANNRLVFSNNDTDTLDFVNLSTLAVTSVPTGDRYSHFLGYSPELDRFVMTNEDDDADEGQVFIFEPDGTLVDTVDLLTAFAPHTFKPNSFWALAVIGNTALVGANYLNGGDDHRAVLVIDIPTATIVHSYEYEPGDTSGEISVYAPWDNFIVGAANNDVILQFFGVEPYNHSAIIGMLDPDNRWLLWV